MTMARKVLHLIDTSDLSGPGKTIVNSCRFTNGHAYVELVAAFSYIGKNGFIEYARDQGIQGFEICERYWWLPGSLSNLAVVCQLRSLMRKERIDLLHSHGFKADVLGQIAVLGTTVRTITTQHGFIGNTKSARLYNRLAVLASKRMDKVIAVSIKMRDTLRSLGVPDKKLVVIHNAIVVADYPPRVRSESVLERHGLKGRRPILGCIGRLSREKGQGVLCEALVKLSEKIPSACLLLIGSGPEQGVLREKYRRYSDRIIFVGHVKNVHDYLSVIDLHVLPSFTEGLPNVVLEAACMGIPTVATAVGGTPECVIDGKTGILVPPGDSDRLAEAILRVVSDDAMRKTLGLNAARFIQEQFSFEHRVARIISVYDEIFEGHNRCTQ